MEQWFCGCGVWVEQWSNDVCAFSLLTGLGFPVVGSTVNGEVRVLVGVACGWGMWVGQQSMMCVLFRYSLLTGLGLPVGRTSARICTPPLARRRLPTGHSPSQMCACTTHNAYIINYPFYSGRRVCEIFDIWTANQSKIFFLQCAAEYSELEF